MIKSKNQLILLSVIFFAFFGWAESSEAANHYVRQGASGNGSDWTNAYGSLPSELTRGDTYYIADGSYGGYTFDDANSGTQVITIKKATIADHGTDAGWSDGYGDGQAVWGDLLLGSDYWVIDGQVRNESNWSDGNSYGFRVDGITANTSWTPGICASNITVRYLNMGGNEGTQYTGDEPGSAIYNGGFDEPCRSWTIEYNYLHNISSYTIIQFAGTDGAIVQYNQFRNSWGKEAIRGQGISKNLIIRWNQFYNACGYTGLPGEGCTAEIAIWGSDTPGSHDNNEIYGNWFVLTRHSNSGGTIVVGGDGVSWVGVPASNIKVFNNTISGHPDGYQAGRIVVNGPAANVCRNNLWYDAPSAFANCGTTSDNLVANSDPFVSYSGENLRLIGGTVAGVALNTPYNLDFDRKIRGADGTWDIGAYEFVSGGGDTNPPSAPSGLDVR